MKRIGLIILMLLVGNCFAQKAWQKDLAVADAYFEQHAYLKAIQYYEKTVQVKKDKGAIERLGESYYLLRDFEKAGIWWEYLSKQDSLSNEVLFKYAKTTFYKGDYSKAKELLGLFSDTLNYDCKVLKSSLDSIQKWEDSPVSIRFQNLRSINSEASDVAPVYLNYQLVFSSDRKGIQFKRNSEQTGNAFFKLYKSQKSAKKGWGAVESFSQEINSPNHEGAACFDSTGSEIYFTRSEFSQGENLNHSDENQLKLYKSEKKNGHWSAPLWFMMNDSLNSFGHPSLSNDGTIFFFVSDMPGGYGGTDIYMSLKLTDTTWTGPINLGEQVNTPNDELYPYYSADKQLYFSSNGHPGFGAFDLYKTHFNREWTIPQNLGKGFNSSYDEFSFSLIEKGKGFFSSNRPGGKGREDLYLFLVK